MDRDYTLQSLSLLRQAIRIMAVAVLYFVCAKLSLMLAAPPVFSLPIWPPAAIALAAVLLGGCRYSIAIFIGYFFIDLTTALNNTMEHADILELALTSGTLASGAALQACFGALLLERYKLYPIAFQNWQQILGFSFIAGPVACLVNPSLGSTALWLQGVIDIQAVTTTWFVWWIGDSVGTILLTPLILVIAATTQPWRSKKLLSLAAPMLLLIVGILILFTYMRDQEMREIKLDFDSKTEHVADMLGYKIDYLHEILHSIQSFFGSSEQVSETEFQEFVSDMLERYPYIQALEWAPKVTHHERTTYETAARNNGHDNFAIQDQMGSKLVAAKPHDFYFPVYYVVPFEQNKKAHGFNLASNPVRLAALMKAANSGKITATQRIHLVQDNRQSHFGVLVIAPIYHNPKPHNIDNLKGFALGVFSIKDLLYYVIDQQNMQGINYKLVDKSAPQRQRVLYQKAPFNEPFFTNKFSYLIGDHNWQITFTTTDEYWNLHRPWQAWSLLLFGLVFSFFTQLALLILNSQHSMVQKKVDEKTKHLNNLNQQLEVQTEKIRYQAMHDPLTSTLSRNAFMEALEGQLAYANRHKTKMGLLYLDLDDFKLVNDIYGHQIGDKTLKHCINRIRTVLRQSDLIGRFGGDEFVILLTHISDYADAGIVAQKLLDSVNQPDPDLKITMSACIGVACFEPDDLLPASILIQYADIALHAAKEHKKNSYTYFSDEFHQRHIEYLTTEQALVRAVQEKNFFLNYQPIYCYQNNQPRIVGIEALLRTNDPELKNMSPALYLPIAEKKHLMGEIGDWVINEACQNFSMLCSQCPGTNINLSINLSLQQLSEGNLHETITTAVSQHNVSPHQLKFELTETAMMESGQNTTELLTKLQKLGVSISIDDFGTGYSSLARLAALPVDQLKIDRSFIKNIDQSETYLNLLQTAIQIGHLLKLEIVLEGVETKEIVDIIHSKFGQDLLLQGYYFCKPIPLDDLIRLLQQ